MNSLLNLFIPASPDKYTENVYVTYEGAPQPDEDPADYLPSAPKGVRIA